MVNVVRDNLVILTRRRPGPRAFHRYRLRRDTSVKIVVGLDEMVIGLPTASSDHRGQTASHAQICALFRSFAVPAYGGTVLEGQRGPDAFRVVQGTPMGELDQQPVPQSPSDVRVAPPPPKVSRKPRQNGIRLKVDRLENARGKPGGVVEPDSLATDDSSSRRPIKDDWTFTTTDEPGAPEVPALTEQRARRPSLLLLLAVALVASVRIWTPAGLQDQAANVLELLFWTEVPVARTAPGPAPLVGQLAVTSTPSEIEVSVDGEPRGITPVQLVLTAGRHELLLSSPLGEVRRTVRVLPGHRTLFSEAIFPGSLVVTSREEVEVRVGTRPVRTTRGGTGDKELVLRPGAYVVNLTNSNTGNQSHRAEILPGQVVRLDADATPGN